MRKHGFINMHQHQVGGSIPQTIQLSQRGVNCLRTIICIYHLLLYNAFGQPAVTESKCNVNHVPADTAHPAEDASILIPTQRRQTAPVPDNHARTWQNHTTPGPWSFSPPTPRGRDCHWPGDSRWHYKNLP